MDKILHIQRISTRSAPRLRIASLFLSLPILFLFSAVSPLPAAQLPRGPVLLLQSYHETYSWTDDETAGVRKALKEEGYQGDLMVEYMDWKRYPTPENLARVTGLIRYRYSAHPPEVVIASDNAALDFALAHDTDIFRGSKIVFCGINGFSDAMIAGHSNVTGVAEEVDPVGTLDTALRLHPAASEVLVVFDGTESGRACRRQVERAVPRYPQVRFRFLNNPTMDEVVAEARKLPRDAVILQGVLVRDRNGTVYDLDEAVKRIVHVSRAPVYSLWEEMIGKGIVGGSLLSGVAQGETAARMALRVMTGEDISRIPVLRTPPGVPIFDYRLLERFEVPESRLPAESRLINRPFSFYETYHSLIWGTTIAFLALATTILLLLKNITRRHLVERELQRALVRVRAEKEKNDAVIAAIGDGMSIQSTDYTVLYQNDVQRRFVGDHLGEQCYRVYEERDEVCEGCPVAEAFADGAIHRGERMKETPEGPLHVEITASPLRNADGRIIGGIELVRDITEQKRTEEALKQETRQSRRYLEVARVLMMALDDSGIITMVNPRGCEVLGYTEGELIGSNWFDTCLPAVSAPEMKMIFARLMKGELAPVDYYENTVITKDGRERLLACHNSLLRDESGVARGVLFSGEDITDRRSIEQERDRLMRELRQKNKELEGIVYVASHDLRSPLVNIQGFSRKLEKGCGDLQGMLKDDGLPEHLRQDAVSLFEETIPRSLGFIMKSVDKMDVLLSGLLRLSRLGRAALTIENVSAADVVQGALAAMAYQIQDAGAEVTVENLPECRGDAVQISQVFTNLLDNAVKYRDPDRPLKITVSGGIEEGRAVYRIEDTGIGIAVAHQEKIWEIFHRLNPSGSIPGEGMGLAVVRRIMDRNEGTVRVESEPEHGSTFIVSLPPADGAPAVFGNLNDKERA